MLSILGTGHFHPETIIDNFFLESLDIGTNQEWIMDRVGIEKRHTVLPLDYIRTTRNKNRQEASEAAQYSVTDLGERAAQLAMQRAGITSKDIGLVLAGVSVPQMCIPSHGCLLAARLGIQAPALDLNSACSTFAAQLHFINSMKPEALPDHILLIQSETYTMATDYSDRQTAVLWGDGAAAQIVSPRRPGKAQVIHTLFESNPSDYDKVIIPSFGHFSQQGSLVQRFAILKTMETFQKLVDKSGLNGLYGFIGHQANLRMLESVCKRIGINENSHYSNVANFGNCGAAGGPSVLSQNWDIFKPKDQLAIVVVGSGLSWGGATLSFGENNEVC